MPLPSPPSATARRRLAERRGHGAERLAAMLLRLKGYRILARGFRLPVGEIDLVAARGGVVAFVEVKRRGDLVGAIEAISSRQRRRIARAAEAFMAARPDLAGKDQRFDVVLVAPRRLPRHILDAWRP
ncbi:YraN family protein [Desertibaculum subflavum]|uniref:YraN family protein n=1 Tax=Desertibaculum subflavum TaxID=2268458 RepID=UPI000E672F75